MCDPVVVRMSVSDKQQENPNGFKSKGGGGFKTSLPPSSSATVITWGPIPHREHRFFFPLSHARDNTNNAFI